jgi:hypothetical protein
MTIDGHFDDEDEEDPDEEDEEDDLEEEATMADIIKKLK